MEKEKPKMKTYQKVLWGFSIVSAVTCIVFMVLSFLDAYQYADQFMFFSMTLAWLFYSCADFRKDSYRSKFLLIFYSIMTVLYVFLIVNMLTK